MAHRRNIADQFEIRWDQPEDFALEIHSTQDGERVQREREERDREQARQEARQLKMEGGL
jgi:hypothetical protein